MSLATLRAKTMEPTRDNMFASTVTIIPGHTTGVVYNRRHSTITKKIVGNIPENIGQNNKNNSCYGVRHWDSKVQMPCFQQHTYVYNFQFQS
jgi:hypothetical protein